jgi:hypothetical protein
MIKKNINMPKKLSFICRRLYLDTINIHRVHS